MIKIIDEFTSCNRAFIEFRTHGLLNRAWDNKEIKEEEHIAKDYYQAILKHHEDVKVLLDKYTETNDYITCLLLERFYVMGYLDGKINLIDKGGKCMKKLKELRKRNSFTYTHMAKELKISKAYYWQIENGKRKLSYMMAFKIAQIFNLTPDEVFYIEFKNDNAKKTAC